MWFQPTLRVADWMPWPDAIEPIRRCLTRWPFRPRLQAEIGSRTRRRRHVWPAACLIAALVLIVWTMLLNAGPIRCPGCRRINLLRRRRTGRQHEDRDDEGI